MNKAYIFSLFLLFTAIGTLLHESGHFIAALLMGCKPVLHYNSTSYNCAHWPPGILSVVKSLSGPFVNILIGTIGIIGLLKKYKTGKEKAIILLAVISFFWSREIVVLFGDLFMRPLLGISESIYLSDEKSISLELFAQPYWLSVILGLLGLWVCSVVVFRLIHKKDRLSFIVFGALGSLAGYVLWFKLLGPKLLP